MTGSLALRLNGAKQLISESAAFQARRGVATAAAALPYILFDETQSPLLQPGETLELKRPFALIGVDRHGYRQIAQGTNPLLGGSGALMVFLSDQPRTPEDHQASFLDFADWISSVMDDVSADVGRDGRWMFRSIELVIEPFRPALTERASDDYWLAAYALSDDINDVGGG